MMNTKTAHRIIDLHIYASIKVTSYLPIEILGHTLTVLGRNIVFIVQIIAT